VEKLYRLIRGLAVQYALARYRLQIRVGAALGAALFLRIGHVAANRERIGALRSSPPPDLHGPELN